jgi:hypothetical protein
MTKTPRTADELKSDSDQMGIVVLNSRKVSQLVKFICAIESVDDKRNKNKNLCSFLDQL